MAICDFCSKHILQSGKGWDYHQPSYEDLKKAADELCVFCSSLRQDIDHFSKASPVAKSNWPAYRWSVRTPGRIRESNESILVTFRSTPWSGGNVDRGRIEDNNSPQQVAGAGTLPERMFVLFPEEDHGPIPTEQGLGKTTNLESSGLQIKKWIEHCTENHPLCWQRQHKAASGFIPKRLLAIASKHQTRVRVLETEPNGIKGPYVTLSHCWGQEPFMTLRHQNKKKLMEEGVMLTELSKNFQDAVGVARFLGIHYMWTDSLCIIQGDKGDFDVEGDLMDQVYRNSYCNIAATDSFDCNGGLFRHREVNRVLPTRYMADGKSAIFGRRAWRVLPDDFWDTQLLRTVLYTRAWTFQERMLAPRILHFAKSQIFWDCATTSACEILPLGLPPSLDNVAETDRHWRGRLQTSSSLRQPPLAGSADNSLEQFWKSAVRKYTSCNLSYNTDKLKAIWGVAKLLRNALEEEYAVGLWQKNLEEQLAWKVADCTLAERPKDLRHHPSWSWASMIGTIELQNRLAVNRQYMVTDHKGGCISFELLGRKRPAYEREPSETWKEELLAMDRFLARVKGTSNRREEAEGRSSTSAEQQDGSRTTAQTAQDRQPELQSISIPIRGHLRRARLRHEPLQRRWTLQIAGLAETASDKAILEVFPDVKPKLREHDDVGDDDDQGCYFVVLAASRGSERGGENEDGDVTFSGVGITLKPAEREGHFYRTGALHFRNLSKDMWQSLEAKSCNGSESADEYDEVNGLKFWLD